MFSATAPTPLGGSLPAFIRAWLLRIQKRIVLSAATLPEVTHKLQDEQLPLAQQLPDELVLHILAYLLPVVQNASLIVSPAEHSAVSITHSLVRHQAFLLWACKMCRSWYSVGTEVLYTSPLLTTTHKMELFERTLSETPSLARFVKAVYAPIHTGSAASDLLGWVFGRRSPTEQEEELSTMLQHCPAVRSLTIRHSVRKGLVSCLPVQDVLRSAQLSDRLENLSLHGSTFEARWNPQFCVLPALTDLLLPHLQVLCLRGIYILPSLHLPVMPRLHTLQLVENRYFGLGPFFLAESLPELRTLEVVGHLAPEAQLGLDRLLDEALLSRLQNLRVAQDERCMAATRTLPRDGALRRLELGMLGPRDHTDAVCWRIPEALESLTFVVGAEAAADTADCVDAVFRCLRLNEEATRLKELVVVHKLAAEGPKSGLLEKPMEELRALCRHRSISLSIEPLREPSPEHYMTSFT